MFIIDPIRYMVAGFSAIVIFCLMFYFAPYMIIFGLCLLFLATMSLAVGYIIVDTYDRWRQDNDKNKSRKKASPSKDVT